MPIIHKYQRVNMQNILHLSNHLSAFIHCLDFSVSPLG